MNAVPLCRARGVVIDTEAGPRVRLAALWATLAPAEQCAWYCQSRTYTVDEHGLAAAEVEEFLARMETLVRSLVDDQGRPAFPGYQQRAMFERGEQIAP